MHNAHFTVTHAQGEFINSESYETLIHGGVGSAKSVALCLKLLMRASVPGAFEILARRKLEHLYSTTLRTLLVGSNAPPILAPGSYTYHKSEGIIRIHGGGSILLQAAGDSGAAGTQYRAGGLEPTGYAVDQLEELTMDEYQRNVLGRVRSTAGGRMKLQVYCACNPGPPESWIAERFGILDSTPVPGTKAIASSPFDNPYLPASYVEMLNTFTGVQRERLVYGKWVGSDKMVYPMWTRARHFKPREGPWVDAIIGYDDGYTAPCAALLALRHKAAGWHVAREVYKAELSEADRIEAILSLMREAEKMGAKVSRVAADPENRGIRDAMARKGIPVVSAKNEVSEGIGRVRAMLEPTRTGEPGLTVDPVCINTAKNIESYELDPKSPVEKPIKRFDHACDALRYIAMEIERPSSLVFEHAAMQNAKRRCSSNGMRKSGTLVHNFEDDHERLQRSLIQREADQVAFIPGGGNLTIFSDLRPDGRPLQQTCYAMFAAVGNGGSVPTVVTIGDIASRKVFAELVADMNAEELARWLAMASIWLGGTRRALVGWTRWGQGAGLEAGLRAYGVPGVWTPPKSKEYGWKPTAQEKSDWVGLVRAAIETGAMLETAPEFFSDAGSWAYEGKHAAPVFAQTKEEALEWVDRIVSRAGLWMMMKDRKPDDPPDPFTWDSSFKRRNQPKQGGNGLVFG